MYILKENPYICIRETNWESREKGGDRLAMMGEGTIVICVLM